MNLAEQLLRALKQRGATEVFGIPGDFALPLFREIERNRVLPLITLLNLHFILFLPTLLLTISSWCSLELDETMSMH